MDQLTILGKMDVWWEDKTCSVYFPATDSFNGQPAVNVLPQFIVKTI